MFVTLSVLSLAIFMMLVERFRPGRVWPVVDHWPLRASHLVHHQDGLHAYNYADLPLWDMLFGTFRNPREWNESCGFGKRETRLLEMLAGKDVNAAPEPARAAHP